jgi:hypothetical protein
MFAGARAKGKSARSFRRVRILFFFTFHGNSRARDSQRHRLSSGSGCRQRGAECGLQNCYGHGLRIGDAATLNIPRSVGQETGGREKVLKKFPRTRPALLASALVLLAAASALAQDSNDARRRTPDAQPVATRQGAQPEATTHQNDKSRTPLTAGEKISRSFRHAFLSPTPYLTSALTAGYTEWRDDKPPGKTTSDAFADWGSRTARNFATGSTKTLFASGFYPALLKQDPRYQPSQSKGFGRRTLHAASRVLITRGDDGRLEPNYSLLAGDMTASALANAWEHGTPDHDRVGTDATFTRFAWMLADDAINNVVFKEFGPDIKRIFRH